MRRLALAAGVTLLSLAALTGIVAAGVMTSMGQSYPTPPALTGGQAWPAPRPLPDGFRTAAVVLGDTGSVAADVLAPYEAFARSTGFVVYTVGRTRSPMRLSGGVHVVPERTFDEALPAPDVVVVPAVADPTGDAGASLRNWVTAQAEAGSRILGVCAGTEVLAASGLLNGRAATSHWSRLDSLDRSYPEARWARGQRFVEDGPINTTAGVTSGVAGALHLIERLAGTGEAERVAAELAYPGWSPGDPTRIPQQRWQLSDLPFALNAAFPWFRPTIAIGLSDGVSEVDVAAAAEVYNGASFAARTIFVGAGSTVMTRHGVLLVVQAVDPDIPPVDRLVLPGRRSGADLDPKLVDWAAARDLAVETLSRRPDEFGFDPLVRDLAQMSDRATALATTRYAEYPAEHLQLTGPPWPWRPTVLLGAAVLISISGGLLPVAVLRARRRIAVVAGNRLTVAGRNVTVHR